MAVTQVGSTLQFAGSGSGAGTVSSTITVPATTELLVVGVTGYTGAGAGAYRMNDGTVTFTKSSADTAMTGTSHNGETDDAINTAMWYMVSPDIGTNKSLKFTWEGSGGISNCNWSLTFWTGIDTASPVRDSDGEQAAALPCNTPTLTAVSGDKIIAFCGWYNAAADGAGTIDSWSNLTEITEITHSGVNEGAWAAGNPTGDTAVGATTGTSATFLAISAIVVKAAAGTSISVAVTGVAATGSVGSVTAVGSSGGGGGSVTARKSSMIGMGKLMGR